MQQPSGDDDVLVSWVLAKGWNGAAARIRRDGYVAWYAVAPRVKVATAGAAQLLVPMVTAAGGLLWLGESVSLDFVFATLLILSGVWLTTSSSRVLRSQ